MHKKLVEVIKYVIQNRPNSENIEFFTREQTTGGFWGLIVRFKASTHYVEHIKQVSLQIGRFYGEELHIEERGEGQLLID